MSSARSSAPHRFRRSARRAGIALVAATALTACSSTGPATTDRSGIIIGRAMDVNSLDISRSLCDTCQIYNSAVYETVVRATPDGELEPLLAESWEVNEDSTQFTFTLDPDAVFADGSPVEAADVAWSWLRVQNLQGLPSYFMQGITGVEATDDQTVVVTSAAPNSAFLNITSASYMGIVNSELAEENGATADADASSTDTAEPWFLENSAGSGQYVLDSYSEGSEIVLSANDSYWGEEPNFSSVTIKEVTDASAQLQQLQQGDIDLAMQISFDALDQIESDTSLTSDVVPSFNFLYLALSPGVAGGEALQDVRVRNAIRMGIDYDSRHRRHAGRQRRAAVHRHPERVRGQRRPTDPGLRPRGRQGVAGRGRIPRRADPGRHLPDVLGLRRQLQHGDAVRPAEPGRGRRDAEPGTGGLLHLGRRDQHHRLPGDRDLLRPRPPRHHPVLPVLLADRRVGLGGSGPDAGQPGGEHPGGGRPGAVRRRADGDLRRARAG